MKHWMMTMSVCVVAAAASVACAQEQGPAASDPVVARIGDEVITEAELETMAGASLVAIRQQLYEAKVNQLNAEIFDRLVGKAAAADGMTVDEFLKANVIDKIGEPDEGEIGNVMSQYRARLAPDDEEARQQVIDALQRQREAQLREELRKELFAANNVQILLEPPRVQAVIGEDTPTRGPRNAPIVLVEYTDYQCPYCGRVQGTLDTLLERYDGKILHAFKNLPLPFHTEAELAGQGALCAEDQNKFWELHDWLFSNTRNISVDTMAEAMSGMGADADAFRKCLEEETYADKVRADSIEARSFGITGTPGFLINGRVLSGAQPLEAFEKVIDEELTRKGIEVPPKAADAAAESEEKTSE